uniref:SAP30-binding protein n=1 Tax=Zosterops lateralis melanops TaxID=1220523 RepID=A0A8D2PWP4_ZOSLA
MVGACSVLSLLKVYTEDSDMELDNEASMAWSDGEAPTGEKGGLVPAGYGEDDFSHLDGDEEGYKEKEDGNSRQSENDDSQTEKPVAGDLKKFRQVEEKDPQEPVASFSDRVWNMPPDEIKIPPQPPGRCSTQLQDKIKKLYERKMKEGMDMNYIIQKKREFRNPTIYEKLIQFYTRRHLQSSAQGQSKAWPCRILPRSSRFPLFPSS